jgi:hypothetical protein
VSRRTAAALVSLALVLNTPSCGDGLSTDPRGDGGNRQFGSEAGPVCVPSQPFGIPALVPGLNDSGSVGCARFTPNELVAYFSLAHGNQDLAVSRRASRSDPFGPPTFLTNVNSASYDDCPSVTPDELTLYFSSDRNMTRLGDVRLYTASRPSANSPFPLPSEIASLTSFAEGGAYAIPDRDVLYFHDARAGNGNLYRSLGKGTAFSTIEPLSVNTAESDELWPVLTPDEQTLYYASPQRTATFDIWMASRNGPDVPFGTPMFIETLSTSSSHEYPSWISPDGCRLYFTRDDGASGSYIYVAAKVP